MSNKALFAIIILSASAVLGALDAILHYRPRRDGFKPGIVSILIYIILGAIGGDLIGRLKK